MTDTFQLLVALVAAGRNLKPRHPYNLKSLTEDQKKPLITQARQHKVLGALYQGLKALSGDDSAAFVKPFGMPGRILRGLLVQEWKVLVKRLRELNIPCLTIKGPASSLAFYQDPFVREFRDLDLLVKTSDFKELLEPMATLGYHPYETYDTRFFERPRHSYFEYTHHLEFQKEGKPLFVEMHDRTWKAYQKDISKEEIDLWAQASQLSWEGQNFDVLNPIDHAVYIMRHGSTHAWCLLHWLLDLAQILTMQDSVFHLELAKRLKTQGLHKTFSAAWYVLDQYFQVELPKPYTELLVMTVPLQVAVDYSSKQLLTGGKTQSSLLQQIYLHLRYVRIVKPGSTRGLLASSVQYLKVQMGDFILCPLPRPFHFLLPFVRPFLFAYRRLKTLLTRSSND